MPPTPTVETPQDVLSTYNRVAIVGGPKAGKTFLADDNSDDKPIIRTDDYMGFPWEDVPYHVIAAAAGRDQFVMEGIQTARALRKGLQVDAVIYLEGAVQDLNPRQQGLSKAVHKWFTDWHEANPDVPTFAVRMPKIITEDQFAQHAEGIANGTVKVMRG